MPFLSLGEIDVYYEVHGEGEPLILLHHGFGCTQIWSEIYPKLVEAGYRIVLYDRRGYGRSGKGTDFWEFHSSDRFRPESVEELKLLKEELGIGPCHLIGQCEGGVVAIDYAARYPEQVRSVSISSTQCYSDIPMEELNRQKFYKAFGDLSPHQQQKYRDWHGEEYAEESFERFRTIGGAYGRGFFDLRPELSKVLCPVLVLYPDRSVIFPVEQGLAFYRRLPFGELMVLPDCGHNTYEQEPEEYTRAVLAFLKRQKEPRKKPVRMTCAA
jgi:pimeloyl-ACP methyl ester carboxylesterase